jgi:hypothetical protein
MFREDKYTYFRIESYPETIYAVIFIYPYLSDEVVDKMPKQSHDSHQALASMQPDIHTTRLMTFDKARVALSECGIQRGSDCSLRAPRLNPGPRRWLTRYWCRTHRGRWSNPLPSLCSLGWWHRHSAAGCEESQSHAERPVGEYSTPPSHPDGVPSPS